MEPTATVVIPIFESEKFLHTCIQSLLAQTFTNFEILIIEDPPYDRAKDIIEAFNDKRIVYIRNSSRLGRYISRNICVRQARGKYVFFTDDDCVASKDWIEQGVKTFLNEDCLGVEGKTIYVSEGYRPTYSDHIVESKGSQFMTCNIAYKKSFMESIEGFDERYKTNGDRDFGLRAIKHGRIPFNPKMKVYHQRVVMTPNEFIREGKRIRNRVLLYKRFGERMFFLWRIVYPKNLLQLMCPPIVFGALFRHTFKSKADFDLVPYLYIMIVTERLTLWVTCAKERIFLV
jgi:glycosyltransferase involved in cell wall biosynthesis